MLSVDFDKSKLKLFKSGDKEITNRVKDNLFKAIEQCLSETKKTALSHKVGNKDDSQIKTSIYTKSNGLEVTGRVYTDFNFAPFLEYGTGEYAEQKHIGQTILFKLSGFRCWYAPKDMVKTRYTKGSTIKIGNKTYPTEVNMHGKDYVLVFGQKPRPFMRPTAFERRKPNEEIINNAIRNALK